MNLDQYRSLTNEPAGPLLRAGELAAHDARTLCVGYTNSRQDFHVYLYDGEIHALITDGGAVVAHRSGAVMDGWDLRPDKRAYPERTDYLFAIKMRAVGVDITFTTFNEEWTSKGGRYAAPIHLDV